MEFDIIFAEDDLWVKKCRQERDVEIPVHRSEKQITSTRGERTNLAPSKEQGKSKHSTDRCVESHDDRRRSGGCDTERDRKYSERTSYKDDGRRHSDHGSKAKNRHGDSD